MEDVPNSLSRTLRMPTASARVTPVDSGGSRSSSDGAPTKLGSTPGELAARAQLPFGLTHDMAAWFIVSAEQTGKKIVAEAYGAFQATTDKAMAVNDPSRSGVRFLVRGHGVAIYQHVPVQREQTSRTRSLWNRLCRRRSNESETPRTAILAKLPRIFGVSTVHVNFDELVEMLDQRSVMSSSLLHPSASMTLLLHTLIDLSHEHTCLRTVAIPPSRMMRDSRDFLVLEYRNTFKLPDGERNGLVVSIHSVNWSGSPGPTQPEAIRGSVYSSGLVAVESASTPGCVDLYCVAEVNLKGDAPEHQNAEMSRHRVQTTLLKIAAAIESRAKAAMALDHSPVYNVARRTELFRQFAECSTCAAEPTGGKLHACRKCYAAVCSECSQIWRRGHKDYRLCIGCWHEAQATETTGSGRGTARFA